MRKKDIAAMLGATWSEATGAWWIKIGPGASKETLDNGAVMMDLDFEKALDWIYAKLIGFGSDEIFESDGWENEEIEVEKK